jgi:hypothetical protein
MAAKRHVIRSHDGAIAFGDLENVCCRHRLDTDALARRGAALRHPLDLHWRRFVRGQDRHALLLHRNLRGAGTGLLRPGGLLRGSMPRGTWHHVGRLPRREPDPQPSRSGARHRCGEPALRLGDRSLRRVELHLARMVLPTQRPWESDDGLSSWKLQILLRRKSEPRLLSHRRKRQRQPVQHCQRAHAGPGGAAAGM